MYVFTGSNPTELYYQTVVKLHDEGDECYPRGKRIKELRPATVEFLNPYNRVTFLGGRKINPFFQLAESLWILSGRADVAWLAQFNKTIGQFSDDGIWFNAPYGERIRSYGKNSAHGQVINPVDQMLDVFNKFMADKDTRQAVIVISAPAFDNSTYTVQNKGKDMACNLVITFKIRHDKLEMTVFNRSNDAHWGLFGANLCQFTTIQETLFNWLKHSGNESMKNLEMGTYTQVTDSLHIYLDAYGAKCTDDVLDYYKTTSPEEILAADYTCKAEPRMNQDANQFNNFLGFFWNVFNNYLSSDDFMKDDSNLNKLMEMTEDAHKQGVIDDYWYMAVQAMMSYRCLRLGNVDNALTVLDKMVDCQWKVSMMSFMRDKVIKLFDNEETKPTYSQIAHNYNTMVERMSESIISKEAASMVMCKLTIPRVDCQEPANNPHKAIEFPNEKPVEE